eukprot:1464953-Rhodomonas_salina.1
MESSRTTDDGSTQRSEAASIMLSFRESSRQRRRARHTATTETQRTLHSPVASAAAARGSGDPWGNYRALQQH